MTNLEANSYRPNSSFENNREATSRDLSNFAIWALTSINKSGDLRRTTSDRSVYWAFEKPDFKHYERVSFSVTHQEDGAWKLGYRYLSQEYPEAKVQDDDDISAAFEYQFSDGKSGNVAGLGSEWGEGLLTTNVADWSQKDLLSARQIIQQVPSHTRQESEAVGDLLLTNQINEDLLYDEEYEIIEQIRYIEPTDVEKRQGIKLDELQVMKDTISRLHGVQSEQKAKAVQRLRRKRAKKQRA